MEYIDCSNLNDLIDKYVNVIMSIISKDPSGILFLEIIFGEDDFPVDTKNLIYGGDSDNENKNKFYGGSSKFLLAFLLVGYFVCNIAISLSPMHSSVKGSVTLYKRANVLLNAANNPNALISDDAIDTSVTHVSHLLTQRFPNKNFGRMMGQMSNVILAIKKIKGASNNVERLVNISKMFVSSIQIVEPLLNKNPLAITALSTNAGIVFTYYSAGKVLFPLIKEVSTLIDEDLKHIKKTYPSKEIPEILAGYGGSYLSGKKSRRKHKRKNRKTKRVNM